MKKEEKWALAIRVILGFFIFCGFIGSRLDDSGSSPPKYF